MVETRTRNLKGLITCFDIINWENSTTENATIKQGRKKFSQKFFMVVGYYQKVFPDMVHHSMILNN